MVALRKRKISSRFLFQLGCLLVSLSVCLPGVFGTEKTEGPASGAQLFSGVESYKLSSFDLVRVTVFGEPEFGISQRISASGAITIPLLGQVDIGGLTIDEARQRIETALIEEEFLRRPQVFVSIEGFSPRRITILGEIGSSTSIELPPGTNWFDIEVVIAMAGGFTDLARRDEVRVTRKSPGDERERVLTVDVDKVMLDEKDGFAPTRFRVLPGDILFVPRRFF
jgi:polysaccharide export outer membrane protein